RGGANKVSGKFIAIPENCLPLTVLLGLPIAAQTPQPPPAAATTTTNNKRRKVTSSIHSNSIVCQGSNSIVGLIIH
ncbi:hypothetical protein ACHAXH_004031, partial [Discostella pseudostelligera]